MALRAEFRQRGLWSPRRPNSARPDLIDPNAAQAPLLHRSVVDEAQILDVLIRLISCPGGAAAADDLFSSRSPPAHYMANCGASAAAVSSPWPLPQVRINYRHHEETRAWATPCSRGFDFDDLDGGSDPASDYDRCFTANHPARAGFEDRRRAAHSFVEKRRSSRSRAALSAPA